MRLDIFKCPPKIDGLNISGKFETIKERKFESVIKYVIIPPAIKRSAPILLVSQFGLQ